MALALGLFAIKLVTLVTGIQPGVGAVSYVVLPLWTLPLAWRRIRPAQVAVAVAAAAVLEGAIGGYSDSVVSLACLILVPYSVAVYFANAHEFALGLGAILSAGMFSALGQTGGALGNITAALFLLAAAVGAGLWVRQMRVHTETLELSGEERVRTALAEERARIARDLHDEVAHAMSVIAVQADAAEGALAHDPTLVQAPLVAIRETARGALGDMRRVLGSLRGTESASTSPEPGLSRLDALVEQTRAGGLAIDLVVEGDARPLPQALDVAAYRVLQEALTNVRKHSGAQRVQVVLRYQATTIAIEVADDGDGSGAGGGSGRGLVGIRERVGLLGGQLVAAPAAQGFVVRAILPLG
jgi:signal transduction histidine kinase